MQHWVYYAIYSLLIHCCAYLYSGKGPEHMKDFVDDPMVCQRFKEVALHRPLGEGMSDIHMYTPF